MLRSLKQKKAAISGIDSLMSRLETGMELGNNTRESIICYLVTLKYQLLRETKALDREKLQEEETVTRTYEGTTFMVHTNRRDDTFDIYYSKPGYPFIYAFGLPMKDYNRGSACGLALDCFQEYEHLFN